MEPLNSLPVISQARQPRGVVTVNGVAVPGWIEWSVSNNNFFEADTFRVSFSASKLQAEWPPLVPGLPSPSMAEYFLSPNELFVEIFAGAGEAPSGMSNGQPSLQNSAGTDGLLSLIYGRADSVEYDPVACTLEFSGRDLAGVFIDSPPLYKSYYNQSAPKIVQSIAANHGLLTDTVEALITASVGASFDYDSVQLVMKRTEWDVLTYLARQQGYVLRMHREVLYYGPELVTGTNPYVIQWMPPANGIGYAQANVIDLKFTRAKTVAKGISVTVMSFNRSTGKPVKASYPTTPKGITPGNASPYGATTQYEFNIGVDKSAVVCLQQAESLYNAIIRHDMILTARMPGDSILNTETPVQVTGTGSVFDATYYPRSVTRTMSFSDGYGMTVEAGTFGPNLQAAP